MADDFDPQDPPAPDLTSAIGLLAARIFDPSYMGRVEKAIGNAHAYGETAAHGARVSATEGLVDWILEHFEVIETKVTGFIISPLARIVGHVLGADVSTAAIRERVNRSGDGAVGKVVAETLFDIIRPPAGELTPGDAGAKRMVGAIGHMTINGWVEGIILEFATTMIPGVESVEAVTELAKELIQNTGISRLSRMALRPLAHVTIATPLQWMLHKQYRPTLLSPAEAIKHFYRRRLGPDELNEVLARHGYGERGIEALMMDGRHYLSPADVDLLFRTDTWTYDQSLQHLVDGGREVSDAALAITVEQLKFLRQWQMKEADNIAASYAAREIDELKFDELLNAVLLDATTANRIRTAAITRRDLNVKHLSLGEAQAAVKAGVWSVTDYGAYLERSGYAHDDAITLELLLHHELGQLHDAQQQRAQASADRAAAAAAHKAELQLKREQIATEHQHFSGTLAQAERLVVRGEISPATYRQILVDHGLAGDDATQLAELARLDHDARASAEQKRVAAAAKFTPPEISIGTLEHAVKAGELSIGGFHDALAARKFSSEDIDTLVRLVQHDVADLRAAEQHRVDVAARAQQKAISLADAEHAVLDGIATLGEFRAWLASHGFSVVDQGVMVQLLQHQLDVNALAKRKADDAAARAAVRGLSIAQEEAAVVAGVTSIDAYRAYLRAHQVTDADAATLVAVLEKKIAAAAAARALREDAKKKVKTPTLSLAHLEAAVVAGVTSLATYRGVLAKAGYSSADVDTLAQLLQPRVIAANQAAARRKQLELEAGQRGTTLAEQRRFVLEGVTSVAEFTKFVHDNGYSADDVHLLVDDVHVALEKQAATAAAHQAASTQLQVKGLTLAQAVQMVKDGIRTVAEYRSFLRAQGYEPADVDALVAELETQLAAAGG